MSKYHEKKTKKALETDKARRVQSWRKNTDGTSQTKDIFIITSLLFHNITWNIYFDSVSEQTAISHTCSRSSSPQMDVPFACVLCTHVPRTIHYITGLSLMLSYCLACRIPYFAVFFRCSITTIFECRWPSAAIGWKRSTALSMKSILLNENGLMFCGQITWNMCVLCVCLLSAP